MVDLIELRRNLDHASLHPESLLNVPLVRQAFGDTAFRFVARSTDSCWTYDGGVATTVTGFNPFEFSFYYGHNSKFAAWLSNPLGSARDYNENDLLVREVLFMVHDYLHAWAYAAIDELRPALRVLHGAVTAETLEEYAFCHLLTEAVATVGLDYWFLSQRGVNEYCSIGSAVGPLTVHYRESQLPEYRRFCPELLVQSPEFFRTIAVFYCSGEFPGFDVDALRRSPQVLKWLRHELSYGVTQRKLARGWLAYLAGDRIELTDSALEMPIDVTEDRLQLIDEMGQRLWAKVKDGTVAATRQIKLPAVPPRRSSPTDRPPDFRFVNLARVPVESWSRMQPATEENFRFFLSQFLGQLELSAVPVHKRNYISLLVQQRSVPLVLDLFGDLARRGAFPGEPRDLLIAN